MFASLEMRIELFKELFIMIVKGLLSLHIVFKWVYKKLQGIIRIGFSDAEIKVEGNNKNEPNSIDLTVD